MDGRILLVDGALPGETVQASYISRRRNCNQLRTLAVSQAAAERVDSGCEYAGVCGGCALRHMHGQAQLAFKESVLLEYLQQYANIKPADLQLLPRIAGDTRHYRRKARLGVRLVKKKGGALVGFREKYSHLITVMSDCQVVSKEVAVLISPLRRLISTLAQARQIPQIEVAVGESAEHDGAPGIVALVFRHLRPFGAADISQLLHFARTHQLHLYLQPGGADSVHKLYPDDEARLTYYLPACKLQLQFHPQDFVQVNLSVNRQLVTRALSLLQLSPTDRVLDLFCGLGNFTLPLAQRCAAVLGVEASQRMVARGRQNAVLNRLHNVRFISADLSRPAGHDWLSVRYHKIVLDPPRSGAMAILPAVAHCGAERILYISCNPSTLARDAAVLQQAGYRLQSAGVMDMFPHTSHVESMALFMPA